MRMGNTRRTPQTEGHAFTRSTKTSNASPILSGVPRCLTARGLDEGPPHSHRQSSPTQAIALALNPHQPLPVLNPRPSTLIRGRTVKKPSNLRVKQNTSRHTRNLPAISHLPEKKNGRFSTPNPI